MDYSKQIHDWCTRFGHAWEKLDPNKVMAGFSQEELNYYESVFTRPYTSWKEAHKLWDVVPDNQKNVKFKFDILMTSQNHAVIHWEVERILIPQDKKQQIDGIFEIKLDSRGLCTYFKQWRTVKE